MLMILFISPHFPSHWQAQLTPDINVALKVGIFKDDARYQMVRAKIYIQLYIVTTSFCKRGRLNCFNSVGHCYIIRAVYRPTHGIKFRIQAIWNSFPRISVVGDAEVTIYLRISENEVRLRQGYCNGKLGYHWTNRHISSHMQWCKPWRMIP